ncbi:hypothetical protein AB0K00_14270 [Dactylosporangium sp. NPDC049525]|uniref:hypothetical protein n=1 Tax=Dactylosporangium sp. NPDC049525 TaxID=3154730 RepID=UPI0034173400
MRTPRLLPVLLLATMVGLTTGCTKEPDTTTATNGAAAGGAATNAAAAPSATVDVKANTEAVCKAVVAAYKAEEGQLLPLGSAMAKAALSHDQQQIAKVKADAEVVLSRLDRVIDAELAKAADTAAKAAIKQYSVVYADTWRADSFATIDPIDEMDKANAAVKPYCPALKM